MCEAKSPCLKCVFTSESESECLECQAPFALTSDGLGGTHGCILPSEENFLFGFDLLFGFILFMILSGMLYGFVKHYVWGPAHSWWLKRQNPDAKVSSEPLFGRHELNELAMRTGWRNAELTKIENWDDDVHREFIVGVGLPVYYNYHHLILVAAGLSWLLTFMVCKRSKLSKSLAALEAAESDSEMDKIYPKIEEDAIQFARMMYWALLFLYVVLLAFSWRFAKSQMKVIKEFDRRNSTTSDYALRLWGVPEDYTSEEDLKARLTKSFNSLLPANSMPVKVKGVTIAYDMVDVRALGDRAPDVDKLIEHLIVMQDCNTPDLYEPKLVQQAQELMGKQAVQQDIDKLQKLFNEKLVSGSGEAFVVFQTKTDLLRVEQAIKGLYMERDLEFTEEQYEQLCKELELTPEDGVVYTLASDFHYDGKRKLKKNTRLKLKSGRSFQLEQYILAEAMDDEATDIIWSNYGITPKEKTQGVRKTLTASSIAFLAIVACVYVPFSIYLFLPYAAVNASPKPETSQITGFLVGLANAVLGTVFGITSWGIGFFKRGNLNKYIILFSTVTSIWNTAFNLSISLYPMKSGLDAVKVNVQHDIIDMHGIVAESELSDFLYAILCPGWLFSGFITGQVVGLIVPTIQNEVLLHLVFTVEMLPPYLARAFTQLIPYNPDPTQPLTVRTAEKIFQWGELALAWDYSTLIVTPSVCFAMLAFISPSIWKIFPRMFVWCSFMYVFHRFVHLRISKKQMHSYPEAGFTAIRLWGIPLSILASIWGYWRSRLGYCERHACIVLFLVSFVAYLVGLEFCFNDKLIASHEKEEDFDKMVQNLHYDWWNTNPLYVLKANFCTGKARDEILPEHRSQPPIPFEFGKEYQQCPAKLERLSQSYIQQMKLGSYFTNYVKRRVSTAPKAKKKAKHTWLPHGGDIAMMHIIILIVVPCGFAVGFL